MTGRIVIGSDHAGFELKQQLLPWLAAEGVEAIDHGVFSPAPSDYPEVAASLGRRVAAGEFTLGVLICGTGAGVAIAANKVDGVRAAAVTDPVTARLVRSHNDANVLCFGSRIVGPEVARELIRTFLSTPFSAEERHRRRRDQLTDLEQTGT